VVQYRTFRNTDPPRFMQLWNQAFTGRSAVRVLNCTMLEEHVLAKAYFDPAGLIFAVDEDRLVGFALGGFGPNESETGLSTATGVVALLGIAPSHRRRGIGSELLRRCEAYLRGRGARTLDAGSTSLANPFTFGLYGGSESAGILASDAAAEPFLARHGYGPRHTFVVFQRRLVGTGNITDGRFPALRRRFEVRVRPRQGAATFWHECVLGPVELIDFLLEEKTTGQAVARASVWEMEGFSQRWNESAIGLVNLEVRSDLRRQGFAKFLLAQTIRYLQDQYFNVVEVQTMEQNDAAVKLYRGIGFERVDQGYSYRRQEPEAGAPTS
jgi:ribosomal protein S18 acetylase RimI-like enzyme